MDSDGLVWLRIEDAGYLDRDGRIWLVGRVKWRVETSHGTYWSIVVEQKVHVYLHSIMYTIVCGGFVCVLVVHVIGSRI